MRTHAWRAVLAAVFTGVSGIVGAAPTLDVRVEVFEEAGPVVRYTSGNALCIEGLADGRWTVQFRSGDGRLPLPDEVWTGDAFQLELGHEAVQTGWTWVGVDVSEAGESPGTVAAVTLDHPERFLRLKLFTRLDGTAVMARWLELTNSSEAPVAITRLAPWSGRLARGSGYHLGYFTKPDHGLEGWFEWQPLAPWHTTVTSGRGQSHDAPFFILRNDGTGEYFIAQLAWPANWYMRFVNDLRGIVTFEMGPHAEAPLRIVAPGETIATPAIHLGHLSGSLDDAVHAMHQHVRASVLPPMPQNRAGLIQYVVPGDTMYTHSFDVQQVIAEVDVAEAIGAELFILDAYWWDVTGDWVPSRDRFPDGLEPLIDYVRSKGMLFGLYTEAEGGRGNVAESQAARAHPEWLAPNGVFNLAIPEAAAWVESELERLISTYRLDLYRLDFNAEETRGGLHTVQHGLAENNYWRYYEACFALYDRIRTRHPHVVLQQAAGGGARNDLSLMQRFHESYLTDGLWIPREQLSFAGQTLAFPPERLVILHGAQGHISPGYPENFDTVLRTTFTLATPQIFNRMVAPSPAELTPTRRDAYRRYTQMYKDFIRPVRAGCRVYHHAPITARGDVASGDWFAMEFAASDARRGWATLVRIRTDDDSDTYVFRPRGIDPGAVYRVTVDSRNQTMEVEGGALIRDGVPVRLESMAMSELLLFERL